MSHLKRIEKVQNILINEKIDFFIFKDPISILYLTGMKTEGNLIISKTNCRFFADKRYIEEVEKKSPVSVFLIKEDLLYDFFLLHAENGKIAFDSCRFSFEDYQKLELFIKKLEKQGSRDIIFSLIPIPDPLKDIKSIKNREEVFLLKKSASLNWRGFDHICSILKEGVTEKSIALEFEIFCLQNGAEKMAFPPIIAFGANSAVPHHVSDETILKKDDIVLIDIGVVVDNYCSDMTRVLFFGSIAPLENLYSAIKRVHSHILSLCKPGMKTRELDEIAREMLEKEGYGKEFVHALGHGVGLEVHEFPRIKFNKDDAILKPGMVITIEPGIYKTGIGGVRYEDTIVITKEGYENLYTSN